MQVEKALGVNLFDDKVKSVAYYKQNKGEAKMVLQDCEQKLLEFMEQLSENEVEAIARGGEAAAAGIVLKKLGVIFAMDCDNAEKALGAELFE